VIITNDQFRKGTERLVLQQSNATVVFVAQDVLRTRDAIGQIHYFTGPAREAIMKAVVGAPKGAHFRISLRGKIERIG
jgi:hypothetical protein